ncbi:MAG: hypothetical protein O2954_12290 [bacterium]|nr:hypothetical protein [bacterium]
MTHTKMVVIKAEQKIAPPSWAVKQRHLIEAMNRAAPLFLEKYTYRGGTLRAHGKLDDDYECFNNWPLFYALGGAEQILDWSLNAWNGITRQWTYQHNRSVHKEFVKQTDMLHLSEGYVGFQNFGLADPEIPENVDRARRFAGLYLGEDPEAANYDPKLRLIRSPITGSAGPAFSDAADYVLRWGHASLYPVVKELEPGWEKDERRRAEIQKLYDETVICGDVPMNLAITGLVAHAFILTGEEKYRRWVLEYVDAWITRTQENNGIIPDNVGLSGQIGEKRNGQWWGGFFGWTGRYSVWMIFHALITAVECAYLVSGDKRYPAFLRSQIDMLLDLAVVRDGNLLVPYKMGPDGWHDYRPLDPYILSHLWHLSMEAQDWERLERLRAGVINGPHAYAYADSPGPPAPGSEAWRPDGLFDWNLVHNDLHGNQFVENEPAHLRFLAGDNPGWPEAVLDAALIQVNRNVDRLQNDEYLHTWASQTLTVQNPILTGGLAQMTLGAPFQCFNGGLLSARVRYFDMDRNRPGLPQDVAALVERLEAEQTVVHLVNTSILETRRLMVQGGAYGEHEFTDVQWTPSLEEGEQSVEVRAQYFTVELPPATSIRLKMGSRCFVRQPTYAFPPQGS